MSLGSRELELWWPEVARRLTRSLARRGVAAVDADDIVQETALRALAAAPAVASQEELARWSFIVARRIEIDRARRHGRSESLVVELAQLRPTGTDTARTAEGRLALATAAKGLASLSQADRTALLSVLDDDADASAADRRAAVREAVRRHRARLRLVAAVGKLVGIGTAAAHTLRRWAGRMRPVYAEAGIAVLAASALLMAPPPRAAVAEALDDRSATGRPRATTTTTAALPAPGAWLGPRAGPPGTPAPTRTAEAASVAAASVAASGDPPRRPGRTITVPLPRDDGGGEGRTNVGGHKVVIGDDAHVDPDDIAWCGYSHPGAACVGEPLERNTGVDDKIHVRGL